MLKKDLKGPEHSSLNHKPLHKQEIKVMAELKACLSVKYVLLQAHRALSKDWETVTSIGKNVEKLGHLGDSVD